MNSYNLFFDWIQEKSVGDKTSYNKYYHEKYLITILSDSNSEAIFNFLFNLDLLEEFAYSLNWMDKVKFPQYKDAIEKKLGKEIIIKTVEQNQENLTYEEFKELLHVNKTQYRTDVFSFFNDNFDVLKNMISKDEEADIKKIAKQILEAANTDIVSINQGEDDNQYTITSIMTYYADALKTLNFLGFKFDQYRNQILELIPYMGLYSETNFIREILGDLSKSEIEKMISSWNKIDDSALKFNGRSVLRFLVELGVHTTNIYEFIFGLYNQYEHTDYEIVEFIEALDNFGDNDKFLLEQQELYERDSEIGIKINELLIKKGDTEAIEWRFKKINSLAQPFTKVSGAHRVYGFESETINLQIAAPLMDLSSKYEDHFIDLIEFSLVKYKQNEEFYEYASYIWRIAKGYYNNKLEENPKFDLRKLQKFANRPIEEKGISLFKSTLNEIIDYQLEEHAKRFKFSKSVLFLNQIIKIESIVDNPRDFNRLLQQVIEEDLRRWVEYEGAYKMIANMNGRLEELFQKTIKGQIELACVKKGFKVQTLREPQTICGKRPDFLLSYGFAGIQLIEVKLLDNQQVGTPKAIKKYMKTLQTYIESFNADNIIYLVVKLKIDSKGLAEKITQLQKLYSEDKRIIVCGLDCVLEKESS